MNPLVFMLWILVGLVAAWIAGFAMERGGYGVKRDILLGVAGSIVGGGLFWILGGPPEGEFAPMAIAAFVGAAIPIVVQRKIWPATA
jgi:uncharacterized membrane protein YeaQ/YmgE (transglycosylase-associated protein family)